ncbi:MAG: SAM-dependent methyltransferase [Bacteroidetes bacterium CG12_big_fil_rev_8_21_14_0_65_60_17]|nr:MAG: SAM-dependent methyltransferase [Bacteroidetes bacterium CG12_big_fil_rev_8_21_14_0_65_60_17]
MLTGLSRVFKAPVPGVVIMAAAVLAFALTACSSESDRNTWMGREIADVMSSEHGAVWLDRPERDAEELPGRLFAALRLTPSDRVADIGAGTGFFTFPLSERVPHGRVYAVEVHEALIDTLVARAERLGARNVEPVLGAVDNPSLPEGRLDLVLIVSSYHEFSHPQEMMAHILRSLRPGGRLVVVEYRGEDDTIPVAPLHRMSEEQIRLEMEAAGFEWFDTLDILPMQHVVTFRRPVVRQP